MILTKGELTSKPLSNLKEFIQIFPDKNIKKEVLEQLNNLKKLNQKMVLNSSIFSLKKIRSKSLRNIKETIFQIKPQIK